MDVLTRCTLRNLRGNPVRTAVTVVGVALACALVFAVSASAQSLYAYVVDVEVARYGSYNATAVGVTAQQAAQTKGGEGITARAAARREGYALVNEATSINPYLCVTALEPGERSARAFCDLLSLELEEGRMPVSPDEIALPATAVAAGLVDAAVGDSVTLQVGHRVDDAGNDLDAWDDTLVGDGDVLSERLVDVEERTFTVVGLYADNYALSRGLNVNGGSLAAGSPALTVAGRSAAQEAAEEPGGEDGGLWQVWLGVTDPANADQIAAAAMGYPDVVVLPNAYVNKITSFSFGIGAYRTLMGLAAVVAAVVVAASVLLIRNSFAISVSERTRQFGLLASVGATRRQLRGMVMREALLLALVGIPLGLAVGYAGTAAVLHACSGLIASWVQGTLNAVGATVALRTTVSWGVVADAVLLALLTVVASAWGPARRAGRMSPVDALRSSRDVCVPRGVRRSGRLMGKAFGVEGSIAAKSYRRAAKPRRATVAALVTGAVLVTTSCLLGGYVDAFFSAVRPDADARTYDLSYFFYESSISGEEGKKATPEQACAQIAAADGVDEGAFMLQQFAMVEMPADALTEQGRRLYASSLGDRAATANACLLFVEDEAYRAFLEQAGLDADALMDAENPAAVVVNVQQDASDGRYAEVEAFTGEPFAFEARAEVGVDSPLNDEPGAVASSGGSVEYAGDGSVRATAGYVAGSHALTVDVAAFVDEAPWWLGTPSTLVALMPLSAAGAVDAAFADPDLRGDLIDLSWQVRMCADNPAQAQTSVSAQLAALGLSDTRLYNRTADAQSAAALLKTARVFTLAFSVIVSLIAVTGAFNTMYTSIGLRRREFAVLRSVGMTRRGLAKTVACECGVYAVRVLLWAAPLCLLVSGALHAALGASVSDGAFLLPWQVVPVSLGAFAVVALAGAYALHKVDAGASPVQALRAETA